MKKILIAVFAITILAGLAIRFLPEPSMSNKYDLDYVLKDVPDAEITESSDGIVLQGLFFPKGTYRLLYENKANHTKTIQFTNLDLNEADYIVPLKREEIKDYKLDGRPVGNLDENFNEFTYNDRRYDAKNANIIAKTSDYILAQLLQPPPVLKLKYDFKISIGEMISILQILTLFIAVLLYFKESRRERNIAKREIYQKLELASIDIFKFEIQHSDRLWAIYDDSGSAKFPDKDTEGYWALEEYVCSILNLFEMIVELQKREVVDTQVFLSWVRWFWDMCYSKNFKIIWNDVDMNYTKPLRDMLGSGLNIIDRNSQKALSDAEPYKQGYNEFIEEIGRQFQCAEEVVIFKGKK